MNLDTDTSLALISLAMQYLDENPQRYTEKEKKRFMDELLKNIKSEERFMFDGTYDFLLHYGLIKGVSRHQDFANYITQRYSPMSTEKVLDIGAGRLCELSSTLSSKGFKMFAMDPNIRLLPNEANSLNIHISKDLFLCDRYAKGHKGTNVKNYDLLIGLEPCLATEHIIHQGLKYEKPFDVVLCYEAHKALNGKEFKTVDDWFNHLLKISQEVEIVKYNGNYIVRHAGYQNFNEKTLLTIKDEKKEHENFNINSIINEDERCL